MEEKTKEFISEVCDQAVIVAFQAALWVLFLAMIAEWIASH